MHVFLHQRARVTTVLIFFFVMFAGGLGQGNRLAAKQIAPTKVIELEGISEYRLSNGIKVLLFADDSKPQFTLNMTVNVGSRHEGYGETGMAHLLEHMLFKGTDRHPDIPKLLKDRGVLNMNGTTWYDRTNFYETLPAGNDNLEFAIDLEADRLLNSWIKAEDLLSEMTVVRNEFEQAENSPQMVLFMRIMATAYEWHNYGKVTIGNRSDIERVPVSSLRKFYRKFYQPDNVMVTVAGQFDQGKALELLEKYFGSLELPERELDRTYTEEPAQDGERVVTLRRVGDTPSVGVGYHIPAASDEQYAAIDVLRKILELQPTGPLYKTMVEPRIASRISAQNIESFDPGMMLVTVELSKGTNVDEARDLLVNQIEKIGTEGVDPENVKRAIQRMLKEREQEFTNSENVAIGLSDWEAYGDWRLYFLHRDRVAKVTALDVQNVAEQFCIQCNRTVGLFIPSDSPNRARIPARKDVKPMLANYRGGKKMAAGEKFDPTPANIDARTQFGSLDSGIKTALLPKKTRGERVNLNAKLHFGNVDNLRDLATASGMLGTMLTRGTKNKSFAEFQDALDELGSTMEFEPSRQEGAAGAGPGTLSIRIKAKRENFNATLILLKEALRSPSLDEKEFAVIQNQQITMMESMKSEPQALAGEAIGKKLSIYPRGDVRYMPGIEESIEMLKSCSVEQVQKLHQDFLNGSHGEIAIVGDFDPESTMASLNDIFSDWKSEQPYAQIKTEGPRDFAGGHMSINTPDKANAMYIACVPTEVSDSHPDYEAMLIGNYILGGGPLSSRLADRVRKKEGLSYGVGSQYEGSSTDESGVAIIFAISSPDNTEKVVSTIQEEVQRMLESGVTNEELEEAKKSFLKTRVGSRSADASIASILQKNLGLGRSMEFAQQSDDRISVLDKAMVDSALRKHLDPKKMFIVTAGDFEK